MRRRSTLAFVSSPFGALISAGLVTLSCGALSLPDDQDPRMNQTPGRDAGPGKTRDSGVFDMMETDASTDASTDAGSAAEAVDAGEAADAGVEAVLDGGGSDASTVDSVDASVASPADAGVASMARDASVVSIDKGPQHACARLDDGRTVCWGAAYATGSPDAGTLHFATDSTFTDVQSGEYFSCGLRADGTVQCWGFNLSANFGDDSTEASPTPVSALLPEPVWALAVGQQHVCALADGGRPYCWGLNQYKQAGEGQSKQRLPTLIGVTGATKLFAGGGGSWALAGDGGLVVWGDATDNASATTTPRPFALPAPAIELVQSLSHACAVMRTDRMVCWGRNFEGQLGWDAGIVNFGAVGFVSGVSGAMTACAANGHTCAVLRDGGAACWGNNESGQLGSGDFVSATGVRAVVGLPPASAIACALKSTCALTSQGVYCWGDNLTQQLGRLTPNETATPLPVVMPP